MEEYDLYPEREYLNTCSYCDKETDNEDYCNSCLKESSNEF